MCNIMRDRFRGDVERPPVKKNESRNGLFNKPSHRRRRKLFIYTRFVNEIPSDGDGGRELVYYANA